MVGRTVAEGTNRGLPRFPGIAPLGNVMATHLATDTDYEAALDDITRRGVSAIRSTHTRADRAISRTADASRGALDSAERVRDGVSGAILHSIKVRPYTTLAVAGLIGFACGALRR
jgi:hypothetical protein